MQIIKASENLTAKEIYTLTVNPNAQKMKDVRGQRLELDKWALYEDVNKKTGELHQILAISTPEGEAFATNSPTFINDFMNMIDLFTDMGEPVRSIVVSSGTSKSGREFITCLYSE